MLRPAGSGGTLPGERGRLCPARFATCRPTGFALPEGVTLGGSVRRRREVCAPTAAPRWGPGGRMLPQALPRAPRPFFPRVNFSILPSAFSFFQHGGRICSV